MYWLQGFKCCADCAFCAEMHYCAETMFFLQIAPNLHQNVCYKRSTINVKIGKTILLNVFFSSLCISINYRSDLWHTFLSHWPIIIISTVAYIIPLHMSLQTFFFFSPCWNFNMAWSHEKSKDQFLFNFLQVKYYA